MPRKRSRWLILVLGWVAWASCAARPEARLVAVDRSIGVLEASPALDQAGRVELASARALWRSAQADWREQRRRAWMLRSYRRTSMLLDDAEVHLSRARVAEARARHEVAQRAREGIARATRAVASAAAEAARYPRGYDTTDDRAVLRADVATLRAALAAAHDAARTGDVRTAAHAVADLIDDAQRLRDRAARACAHGSIWTGSAGRDASASGPPTL